MRAAPLALIPLQQYSGGGILLVSTRLITLCALQSQEAARLMMFASQALARKDMLLQQLFAGLLITSAMLLKTAQAHQLLALQILLHLILCNAILILLALQLLEIIIIMLEALIAAKATVMDLALVIMQAAALIAALPHALIMILVIILLQGLISHYQEAVLQERA